jgi:hypothetical protein
MGLTKFPNGVSSFGMPIIGSGPVMTTGNVFFVDSGASGGTGSNQPTSGKDTANPFITIDYAVGQCSANNGDIIFVMPGHTETVIAAMGLDLDVAGITLIGLGSGSSRPTINLTTAVGASMSVDAANVTMVNFLFTGGIDALTGPIDVNAADFSLINIETRDVTGQATDWIVTDANATRLTISGWKHAGATAAGADTAISIVGGDGHVIENFSIYGNFAVAAIENVTTAMTNAQIGGGLRQNYIQNGLDTATVDGIAGVSVVATSTGHIGPNINIRIGVDATSNVANITGAIVGAAMQMFQPINVCNLGGEVAMQSNISASTDA